MKTAIIYFLVISNLVFFISLLSKIDEKEDRKTTIVKQDNIEDFGEFITREKENK